MTNKERNPRVPLAPLEIARDALDCLAAGAAIVHNHIDKYGIDGAALAQRQLEGWCPVLEARPDAIVYPTVGFGGSIEERYAHIPLLAESGLMRMSVLDPGSVNFGGVGEDGLPGGAIDVVYVNTYADIRHEVALCETHRLGPSVSIFEPGFLRAALAYHRAGRLPRRRPDQALLRRRLRLPRRSGGAASASACRRRGRRSTPTSTCSKAATCRGRWRSSAATSSPRAWRGWRCERGGHVRVGLEDYAGPRTPANAELVEEVVALAGEVGRPVAGCAEAARLLQLPRR